MQRLTTPGHIYKSYHFMDSGMKDYLNKLAKYEDLEERIEKEYSSNISVYDIMDMFLKATEEQDKEPLKGFRILTNDDAKLYDKWKTDKDTEEKGLLVKLPCKVGDTVYIVSKCDRFPPQLDGTMWDSSGGYGTATGYYCPYENNCPHETDDCEKVKNELNVFEDALLKLCIEEDNIWLVCENSNGWELKDFGVTIFTTRKEAEQALKGLER